MSYAAKKDGRGFRAVASAADCDSDEVWTETLPIIAPDARDKLLGQIAALEATVTARRLREAILGDDGWLANADAQIAALRAQL